MIQLIAKSRAFYFKILKIKIDIQEVISLYSFDKILILKYSMESKIDLEEEEIKRYKD